VPDADVLAAPALVIVPAVVRLLVGLGGVICDMDDRTVVTNSPDSLVRVAVLATGRSDESTPKMKVLCPAHTGEAKLKVSLFSF
jgi:hypothetical protein